MISTGKWIDEWTVILRYPNGSLCHHNFKLSKLAASVLGARRAECDAKAFVREFQDMAGVVFLGRTKDVPWFLHSELFSDHIC